MKQYICPVIKVVQITESDIVRTSGISDFVEENTTFFDDIWENRFMKPFN